MIISTDDYTAQEEYLRSGKHILPNAEAALDHPGFFLYQVYAKKIILKK